MSNDVTIYTPNSIEPVETKIDETYGFYVTKSHLCPICNKKNHMEVNLLRSRDHLSYEEISQQLQSSGINPTALDKHFSNHFIISPTQKKILDLKQENSPESLAIVTKIFEGEMDIFSASQSILESKGKRLHAITRRLEFINAHLEVDQADDIDKQEFVQLNKIATEIEDSMENIYKIMDKKLFPASRDELSNAILQYKLNVLTKIVDNIQIVLLELEVDPKYSYAISKIREVLAYRVSNIEDEILKSGGFLKSS